MRKVFSALTALVLLTSGVASAARPAPTRSASAYAPAPPTPPAVSPGVTPLPAEPRAADQSVPTPPPPAELPPETEEKRARDAIEAVLQKRLDYWGPRYNVAAVEVTMEGQWAHGVAKWQSEEKLVDGPIHVLARRSEDGTWQALMPSEEGLYLRWVEEVPERLVPTSERDKLRTQATAVDGLRRPQVTPAIPPAATLMPPDKGMPDEHIESVSSLAEPTETPTPTSECGSASSGDGSERPHLSSDNEIAARVAIESLPQLQTEDSRTGYRLEVFDIWGTLDWAVGELALVDKYGVTVPSGGDIVIAWKNADGHWIASMKGTEDFNRRMDMIPDAYLASSTKRMLYVPSDSMTTLAASSGIYRLPYSCSTSAYVSWVHSDPGQVYDIDFGINGTDIVAARDGWIAQIVEHHNECCYDSVCEPCNNYVVINHGDGEYSYYLHIKQWSVPDSLSVGTFVQQGEKIAEQGDVGWTGGDSRDDVPCNGNTVNSRCGIHLHFGVHLGPYWNSTTVQPRFQDVYDNYGTWYVSAGQSYQSGNCGGNGGDQVKLWSLANYDGSVMWSGGTGFSNGPNADSYSMEIPGGWSVKTWTEDNRGGSERCWSESVPNLQDHGWHLAIQSIEVFDHNVCQSPPPGDQVKLWSLANYDGSVVWSGGTGFSNGPNADSYSMEIPGGWSVKTWTEDNRGGSERCWSESVPNLQDHGWHLAIQSIEVFDSNVCPPPSCNPNSDQIALFVDSNYSGQCVVKGIGEYSNPGAIGLPNDSISSIKVGSNVQGILCQHDNYAGICETFTDDDSDLSNNSIGNDQVSSAKVQWPAQPPSAPTLQSPGNGSTFDEGESISLSWSDTGDEYYGEVWGGPGGTLTFGWQSGTSYNLGSQWAGYTYSWHVKARNDAGESGWSDTWTFTVKPEAPSNLSAQTASCSEVNLYWDDNSGNEEGYKIYRDGSYVDQVGANTTSYQDTGLSENTSYSYYVKAFRGSIESNASNTVNVTTPSCAPPQPDLMPSQWGGWQYPVVPSSITDTNVVNTLYAGYPTYIDWGLTNYGDADTGGNTYGALYIDDVRIGYHDFGDVQAGWTWAFSDWVEIVDTPGWHTLKSVADPDDLIDESDETNNVFERDFYWTPSAPYTDDMESGMGDWAATGLWHQVNEYTSPYPESHSWSHSWWYGQDGTGDYDTGTSNSGDLTSPPIYIPDSGYYLRFWYWYETETQGPDWDQRWVQISVEDDSSCSPGSDEIGLYVHSNYGGQCVVKGIGNYANSGTIGLPNDSISSIKVGENVEGVLCEHDDFAGTCETFTNDDSDLSGNSIGNDQVSSARVQSRGGASRVHLYDSVSYSGSFNDVLQLYDDPQEWWLQGPVIDLSGYAGHTIRVRFHFNTLDDVENDYRGWYIDDFEISDTPPPSCGDAHEPNDTTSQATSIAYGQSIDADICAGGDYDFYQFTGSVGDKVVVDVDAEVDGSLLDSYIYLLDSDGTDVLAQNDDEIIAEVHDSHLGYQLPQDGTYYIKVKAWDHPSAGSADHFYTIHLLTDDNSPSAEITSPDHYDWLDPDLQTITTDVSDAESGIRNVTFYWHDADWDNSDWIVIEDDHDPRDGWTYDFDTSSIPEQSQGGVVFIYAYDWAGNYVGYGSYSLGLDRTPPDVTPDAYPAYGDAPFRDFWVNWWDSWDNLSGVANYDVQYRDSVGGAWTDFVISTTQTYTRFVGLDDHTYYFRARAQDQAGNLSAYSTDEVSHTVDVCTTAADAYEADGSIGSASWITPDGYSQIHNFHTEGDADWVTFEAQAGITYTLSTGNTGGHADTVLELYDIDGSTLLAENDDCPGRWPASCLDWQPTSDGVYYAKVTHWDPWAYGCTAEYGLSIVSDREPTLDLGEPGTSFRYADTFGVTELHYIADAQHLNFPDGIFVDAGDNLWVTERHGARVLKYNSSGSNVLTLGKAGYRVDDEDAFNEPADVAVDDSGNIWVVDRDPDRVVKFDSSGNYVSQLGEGWNEGTDDDLFRNPRSVAFDSAGNIYVADTENHRVQIFDSSGTYSQTLGVSGESGSDNAHFDHPAHVTLDSQDNLYVSDANNHRVQIFDGNLVYSDTLGGTQGTGDYQFNFPWQVAIDDDNIYVADSGNHRIQIFDSNLNYVDTLGQTGVSGSTNSTFNIPHGVAVDSNGEIYVSDMLNHRIQKFDSSLNYVSTIGTTSAPYVTDDQHYNAPHGIAADDAGNILLTEDMGYRLIKLNAAGEPQWTVGEAGIYGSDNAHFGAYLRGPTDVALDGSGNVYVADTGNHRIQIYDSNGGYLSTLGGYGSGDYQFHDPYGVAVGSNGNIYVADEENHRVQIYDSSYAYQSTLGVTDVPGNDNVHFSGPKGVAVDSDGYVYVTDAWNRRVQKCAPDGSCTTFAGVTDEWGEDFGHFWEPRDVAVDAQGRVYVADIYHQRVQVFDSSGAYLTTIGDAWGSKTGELRHAAGVAVDGQGNLYVADEINARVQKFALGVPDWQQVNVNGFGDKDNVASGITLHTFQDRLYAGFWKSSGGQLWRTSDGTSWIQVTSDGFGDTDNTGVEPGATFNGYLYAGTWNGATGCEVHRSADGLSWDLVRAGGFGDADNAGVDAMAVFSDHLYAGTYNESTGAEVWRTADGATWSQVNADGFGDADNVRAWSMTVFDGALYVGTQNFDTGAEIWRSPDGTIWEQVDEDGFGDSHNQWPNLAVYDGDLYVGFANDSTDTYTGTGTQIWRSEDGEAWEQVVDDGFGDTTNGGSDTLVAFGPYLYSGTYNRESGTQLRSTTDGTTWARVAPDGFGDSNNYSTYGSAVFGDRLFLATANDAHGTEVWRSDLQLARADFDASPTRGVAPLTVDFTNLSTGDYDTCAWGFGDGGVSNDCSDLSHEYTSVGTYTVALEVDGLGGSDVITRTEYVTVRETYEVYLPLVVRGY